MKMKINAKTYREARTAERAIINYLMDEWLAEEGWSIEIDRTYSYSIGADMMKVPVAVYKPRHRSPENVYEVVLNTAKQQTEWVDYAGQWKCATGHEDEYRAA